MNPQDFFLVFGFSSIVAILLVTPATPTKRYVLFVIGGAVAAFCVICALSWFAQDRNPFFRLITFSSLSDRTGIVTQFAALSLGLLAGVSVSLLSRTHSWRVVIVVGSLYALALGSTFLVVMKDAISPYLSDPNASSYAGVISSSTAEGWQVEQVVDLPLAPTSICVSPDAKSVFVAGYSGNYMQNGAVARIDQSGASGEVTIVAAGLTRPHGIAISGQELFVSRAGQFAKATDGVFEQFRTGAITRLRDLDGDGLFEHYHDIVDSLPGPQLPDGLHQNNGIAFGPDGLLYITVGNVSNQAPPQSQYEGTIIRCDRSGDSLEVFAEGLRNPYGICVDDVGSVFCTDNDPNVTNPGDELNLVKKGDHLGHPYDASQGVELDGAVPPILRLSSAQGLDSIPDSLEKSLGGQLLVASYGDDAVNLVRFGEGDRIAPQVSFFARVPGVVDVACSDDGLVFACSYVEKRVYVFSRKD